MPPGSAKPSSACRDIHAIAEDVVILDHNIAHVDSNPELDAFIRRRHGIPLGHSSLYLGRATQRIDHTAELDEQAVACRLDEPAVVRGNHRIDQLGSDRPER
jgi:hypothetical protein